MYKIEIASVLKTPAQQKEVGIKQEIQSITIILKFIQELVGEKKGGVCGSLRAEGKATLAGWRQEAPQSLNHTTELTWETYCGGVGEVAEAASGLEQRKSRGGARLRC